MLLLQVRRTRRRPEAAPVSDRGVVFCACAVQLYPHSVHEREIQIFKMTKVTTKERNYVKGTWNILIVNVNLNTVSISSPRRKVQHSCTLSTYLNSLFTITEKYKTNNEKIKMKDGRLYRK